MTDEFRPIPEREHSRSPLMVILAVLAVVAGGAVIWTGARPDGPLTAHATGILTFVLGFVSMLSICTLTAKRRVAAVELSREFADKALAGKVHQLTREISVRKDMENGLFAATEAAEAAIDSKTEFLANVSHELKTPMTAIISSTDLLLTSQPDPESYELLKIVKKSSDNMMVLIGNLLDLAKGESGNIELEHSSFDLREVIDTIARPFMPKALDRSIRLMCDIDPNVPEVVIGDPRRLQQILNNLIDNAIKFTHRGHVKVSVTREPEDSSAETEYARLLFSVEDTGIGIPMDVLHMLFDVFTQADGSSTRPTGGMGLGLSITRQLVEIMGGNITVESKEGVGSTFRFVMKFRMESQPQGPSHEVPSYAHKLMR